MSGFLVWIHYLTHHFALCSLFRLIWGHELHSRKKSPLSGDNKFIVAALTMWFLSIPTDCPHPHQLRFIAVLMPTVVQGCKQVGLHLPSVRIRVTYNHQHNLGQLSRFPNLCSWRSPYKLLQENWLPVHKSFLTAPSSRMTSVLRLYTETRNAEAIVAMRRRDREPAYREEDENFFLSCPLISAHGVRQTKKWLLNVESVHDHADMLVKSTFFSSVTIITHFFFLR